VFGAVDDAAEALVGDETQAFGTDASEATQAFGSDLDATQVFGGGAEVFGVSGGDEKALQSATSSMELSMAPAGSVTLL
jgi:hypothetical protein